MEEKPFALGHEAYVNDICLDYFARRMASCSDDGSVRVSERTNTSWKEIWQTNVTGAMPMKLAWSRPEHFGVLACAAGRSVLVWEESAHKQFFMRNSKLDFTANVACLLFPVGEDLEEGRLVIGLVNGQVFEMQLSTGIFRPLFQLKAEGELTSLSSGGTKGEALVCAAGNQASVWVNKNARWRDFGSRLEHQAQVNHVAWGPTGLIATASGDGTCKLWKQDFTGGKDFALLQTLQHEQGVQVFHVEWSLTGTMLVTNGDDGLSRLWAPNMFGEWSLQVKM